eukprot:Nk52_evm43s1073 gene=Nk52_evmTU43s1073
MYKKKHNIDENGVYDGESDHEKENSDLEVARILRSQCAWEVLQLDESHVEEAEGLQGNARRYDLGKVTKTFRNIAKLVHPDKCLNTEAGKAFIKLKDALKDIENNPRISAHKDPSLLRQMYSGMGTSGRDMDEEELINEEVKKWEKHWEVNKAFFSESKTDSSNDGGRASQKKVAVDKFARPMPTSLLNKINRAKRGSGHSSSRSSSFEKGSSKTSSEGRKFSSGKRWYFHSRFDTVNMPKPKKKKKPKDKQAEV